MWRFVSKNVIGFFQKICNLKKTNRLFKNVLNISGISFLIKDCHTKNVQTRQTPEKLQRTFFQNKTLFREKTFCNKQMSVYTNLFTFVNQIKSMRSNSIQQVCHLQKVNNRHRSFRAFEKLTIYIYNKTFYNTLKNCSILCMFYFISVLKRILFLQNIDKSNDKLSDIINTIISKFPRSEQS